MFPKEISVYIDKYFLCRNNRKKSFSLTVNYGMHEWTPASLLAMENRKTTNYSERIFPFYYLFYKSFYFIFLFLLNAEQPSEDTKQLFTLSAFIWLTSIMGIRTLNINEMENPEQNLTAFIMLWWVYVCCMYLCHKLATFQRSWLLWFFALQKKNPTNCEFSSYLIFLCFIFIRSFTDSK